ncbi:ABC-type uncharacterized transport system substrate-binding protein [Pseudorhizobium tarimense]|uniref:ABC-type uncharacterized transport system substrate-binding protein n=1 Tax=Pseudorhizobium tarimense TaxID=1079109 RepID=A0ABV2HCR4_9HYPH|nr:DUF1007 family protein [Pseudorhizobium tarimense]MCJ8521394.1 DUF1007 family protein [Pseudorhizobium tarimense]
MKHALPLLTALALSVPSLALAHPHIFAEARLEVIAGDDGNIQELRNVWRFDEVFSSSVLLDFDANTDLKLDEKELAELGEVMRTSLADFDYFTTVTADGKSEKVQKPDVIHVSYDQNQVMVFFAVKPEKTLPLKGKLTFGIYDRSMYTAIDFPTDEDLVAQGKAAEACKREVVRPDPDEIIAENSATLTDAFFNDPTGTDMSKLFATRLELTC